MRQIFAYFVLGIAVLTVACSGSSSDSTATVAPDATASAIETASDPDPTATAAGIEISCSFDQSLPNVLASIFAVEGGAAHGTAFHIGGGEFITTAATIGDQSEVMLRQNGQELVAETSGVESATDIAVLSAQTDAPAVTLVDAETLTPATALAVVGYLDAGASDPSIRSGLLSALVNDPDVGFGTFLEADAADHPGASGAPVFDACGSVIGMVNASAPSRVDGLGLAIASNTVESALPRVRRRGAPEAEATPDAVDVAPTVRYISGTGGSGVAIRSDCSSDARAGGTIANGTEVTLIQEGIARCDGWSVITSGSTTSWVSDGFLTTTPAIAGAPPTPAPTARPTAQPTVAPTATPTPRPTATPVPTPAPPDDPLLVLGFISGAMFDVDDRLIDMVDELNLRTLSISEAAADSRQIRDEVSALQQTVLAGNFDLRWVPSCHEALDAYEVLLPQYIGNVQQFVDIMDQWPNGNQVPFFDTRDVVNAQWDVAIDLHLACLDNL